MQRHKWIAVALLAACSKGRAPMSPDANPPAVEVADFALLDVNPNSPTVGQQVSPSQLKGAPSAWYFTHTT